MTAFSDLSEDNDPHRERDFGAFEVAGQRLFWTVDYYDLCRASADPANPAITKRVLNLILVQEY